MTASALPVTDSPGMLVGIVTIDDVLDVAEERGHARTSSGSAAWRPSTSRTWQTPLLAMVRKRGTWLVILFLGEMLTATAMGYFEKEIARGGGARPVRAAHHLQRRQLGLPGGDPRSSGPWPWARSSLATGGG